MFQSKLLKLPDDGIPLDTGLWLGVHHNRAPLWIDGNNVRFNNSSVQKSKGYSQLYTPTNSNPVIGCHSNLDTTQNLFFGTASNLYVWNSTTESSVGSGYTGVTSETVTERVSQWSMVSWGSWVVASNGKDPVQVFKGVSFAALANTPFTSAEVIMKWGPYLIAMNTSNGSNYIEWSDEDDIENWTVDNTTTAGNHVIRDLESPIVAAVNLGQRIAIFSRDSMHIMAYTGANFIFGVNPGPKGVGAVSKHAVVAVSSKVFGLSEEGFFVTDGHSAEYIDEPAIREYYEENINYNQLSKVNAYHNKEASSIVWNLPGVSGDISFALIYDYKRKVWTKASSNRTASIERNVFRNPITFADNIPYLENFGDDADSSALIASVESRPFSGNDSSIEKWIDHLVVQGRVTGGPVKIALGFQNKLTEDVQWLTREFVGDSQTLYYEQTTRWVRIKIYSEDTNTDWEITSIELFGRPIGGQLA